MKKIIVTYRVLFFCVFCPFVLFSQETPNTQSLIELQQLSHQILKEGTDPEKDSLNVVFKNNIQSILTNAKFFSYPFDELKTIARFTSTDKQVRIFNWHIPYSDGTFSYHAFVVKKNNTENKVEVFELTDNKTNLKNIENSTLKNTQWFGAHYYNLIEVKNGKQTYYTLLGWDGNNLLTNRKVIEVLYFNNNNELLLGASIFKSKQKPQKRYLFEYADEANFTLNYNEKERCIIFDHLSPISSGLKDVKAYHVPDGSFDAFKLEKGKWIFISDYDARLEKNIKDKFYKLEKTPQPNK
ncbi:MAG: hypothetical protein HND27_08125 [Bacteroidetes bacterium]|nr:hypothetical protein [Bacteroidota bacterium]MBV6461642.1 hypothetical protein [Flavobacteriales bacterium]WKZ74120.1 MAG: hypothetical protein QY303_08165 [Vicingaceae bacterium]MCL4816793.1 hypothetical protein [Flavobacteriales bacterium]NOG95731.1 hypothetical protein [Bacteroidota bacterium]